ncbi:MAG: Rab family GTPase [Promethearchaeota archaeon]
MEEELKEKFTFKVTVIGDGFVGKTSLIKKFTQGGFQEDYIQTIGAQWSKYEEQLERDKCKLFFWDIAGQDAFHFLRPVFYKSSLAAIIVFSIEDNDFGQESFKHITNWHDEIKKFCGDIPIILFGNKVDLVNEEKIDEEKIMNLVKERNFIAFFPTSAKTGQNVEKAFKALIEELHDRAKD